MREQDLAMAEMPAPTTVEMPTQEPMMEKTSEYRPSNQETLREYEIRIKFLHRGCIVSVGCKEIAFEDNITAINAVNAYVKNPYEQQKVWRKILD